MLAAKSAGFSRSVPLNAPGSWIGVVAGRQSGHYPAEACIGEGQVAFPLGERSRGGIDETPAFPSCMRIREVGHVRRCEEPISWAGLLSRGMTRIANRSLLPGERPARPTDGPGCSLWPYEKMLKAIWPGRR